MTDVVRTSETSVYLNGIISQKAVIFMTGYFLGPDLYKEQNIVVNTLLRIREVPGSSLGPRPAILTEVFSDFSQSLQANAGIIP